jgi:hypothetical protein
VNKLRVITVILFLTILPVSAISGNPYGLSGIEADYFEKNTMVIMTDPAVTELLDLVKQYGEVISASGEIDASDPRIKEANKILDQVGQVIKKIVPEYMAGVREESEKSKKFKRAKERREKRLAQKGRTRNRPRPVVEIETIDEQPYSRNYGVREVLDSNYGTPDRQVQETKKSNNSDEKQTTRSTLPF